ncbi:MAG: hypothetical protein HKM04_04940, partial [Legionellales bacterium]|nr:hypothetical protein [Legionellales bacterium]
MTWLFVGDVGLRRFIAQEVDRLDDIVSYEVKLEPLTKPEFELLINKRIEYYRENPKANLLIDNEVFFYLYDITKGRLRYIFGLLQRLMSDFHVGDLTDRISLDIAKPMVRRLAHDRIKRNDISPTEEQLLRMLVEMETSTVSDLAHAVKKSKQYTRSVSYLGVYDAAIFRHMKRLKPAIVIHIVQ